MGVYLMRLYKRLRTTIALLLQNEAGFSLIEMAIVLVIMGLLLGGILKGQDLIENARLRAVQSQINEFRLAVNTFFLRYNALPGDYSGATSHINGHLRDGDDDGLISGAGLAPQSQAFQFWLHLSAAGLLTLGVRSIETAAPVFGQGAPASRLGGGFTVEYDPDPQQGLAGHWYVLGSTQGDRGDGPLLTPQQAMMLDKQADTGHPTTGRIRAKDGRGVQPFSCVTQEGAYNLNNTGKVCTLYFQF